MFIGLTTIDLQFLVKDYPLVNTKVKALKYEMNIGGPAANAAIAFSHLGGSSHILTGIGKNNFTGYIKNEFKKFNIEVTDITPDYSHDPTFASIITSESNGDRTVLSYNPVNEEVECSDFANIDLSDYDIIHIDGFHGSAAIDIIKKARKYKIPVVFDGGSWKEKTSQILDYCNIIICSDDFYPPDSKDKHELLQYLAEEKNIKRVAITRGKDSILYVKSQRKGKLDVFETEVIDTLGAGDIFHGAFCFFYVNGNSFIKSLKKAAGIASESCKYFGTRAWMEAKKFNV